MGPVPIRERLPEGPLDGPEERVHGASQEGPGGGIRHVRRAGGSLWQSGRALLCELVDYSHHPDTETKYANLTIFFQSHHLLEKPIFFI